MFGALLLHSIHSVKRFCLLVETKSWVDQKRFYKRLIFVADNRYSQHLATLNDAIAKETKNGKKTR